MRAVERAFSGARLRLARAFNGWTQVELARRVEASHQYVAFLEAEQKRPTELLVAALASACGFEPSFFYAGDLREFRDEQCHFRRRQSTSVGVRVRLLAHGTLFAQLVDFLDHEVSLPDVSVPDMRARGRLEIETSAEQCRTQMGLGGHRPIGNMARVLENAGVVVTQFVGFAEKVDAFSMTGPRNVVVLNLDKGSASRSRFDMAHELGHLVLHGGQEAGSPEMEAEADRFASAFLLPRMGYVREFPRRDRLDWAGLFALKQRWKVSVAAMVRRAYDLRLIDAIQYRQAYKHMSGRGWLRGEPHEFEPERPEVVCLALDVLERQGRSRRSVCSELGWAPATFARVVGEELPDEPPRPRIANVLRLHTKSRDH